MDDEVALDVVFLECEEVIEAGNYDIVLVTPGDERCVLASATTLNDVGKGLAGCFLRPRIGERERVGGILNVHNEFVEQNPLAGIVDIIDGEYLRYSAACHLVERRYPSEGDVKESG